MFAAAGGKLIRVLSLLVDVGAAPAPHNQDNLRTSNTVRPLESPKAPAAERDAAERSVELETPILAFPDIIMGSGAANCRTTVDHLPGGRLLAGGGFDCCSFYSTAFISCGRPQDAHSAENKNRSKRKRCEVWGENPKQNDWRRAGDWPVGMKNIGNTCWFSAVIQVISKKSSLISNLYGLGVRMFLS